MAGSFGGAFNGNSVNCKSYATVYGHNYVGGIIGFKGQSRGNLIEWLEETTIMVPNDATALDVIQKAAKAYGISYEISDSQYGKWIASMTKNGVTLDDSLM